MAMRVSGMNSGLDTESIVSALVMNYRAKETKAVKAQTSLQYKIDALKNVNTDVYSLFSTVDKMRWSSSYSLKSTTVSDTTKAKVSAGDTAVNGTQTLDVKELAQAGYLTGGNVKSDGALSTSTKLSDIYTMSGSTKNSFAGGSISLKMNGKETTINLTEGMTAQNLVNTLKDAGINASFDADNGRFFISSKQSGVDNDFSLVANDAKGLQSLKALGLYTPDDAAKAEYQKWADYGNMTEDEWNAFVDDQYKSKTITVESKAESYASQYNAAMSTSENAKKDMAAIFETLVDEDKKPLANNSAEAKDYAEKLKEARDKNSLYDDYRNVTDNEDGTKTITYDKEKMAEALKDGKLTQEQMDKFNEDEAEIFKYENAATKLAELEKTDKDAEKKMTDLESKVAFETGDDGKTKKAVALTADNDSGKFAALEAEVADENLAARNALNNSLKDRVKDSKDALAEINSGAVGSEGAVRIAGSDAKIVLNGAEFTSKSNSFSINGLSIEVTGKTENGPITITTNTDTQGIYDKIKDFLGQYNDVINKINKLYSAPSAKGYDPLTDDEKKEMSDTEVSKWESKIKDSILRRDDTLSGIIQALTSSMSGVYDVNGKGLSLGTFGISTLGLFGAQKNEQYAYHIDGDSDDSATSGKSDKLMAAIIADPDSVVNFFQQLSSKVYDSLNAKMKSTSLSSAYTIYNDKEMSKEYSDYTKTVAKWQDKVATMEEQYFKKFAAMEKQLAALNSQTSSMSSFFG